LRRLAPLSTRLKKPSEQSLVKSLLKSPVKPQLFFVFMGLLCRHNLSASAIHFGDHEGQ
jgi:hypothetical protein